jgi:hypothetical protein
MSNVVRLVRQQKKENPLNLNADLTSAVTDILTTSADLGRALKELSARFDAMDYSVDALGDKETRHSCKQAMKLSREALAKSIFELSREIRKLPSLCPRAEDTQSILEMNHPR